MARPATPLDDPVSLFKLLLTGYLETLPPTGNWWNIAVANGRVYFLGFDIDEDLRGIQRSAGRGNFTRHHFRENCSTKYFALCVDSGDGNPTHRQSVDFGRR